MSSPDAPDLDAIEALYAEWQNPDSRVSLASIGTEAVRALPVLVAALREARTEIQIHAECMDAWDRQSAALRAAETKLAAIHTEHQPDGDYGYSTQCTACGTMWPCSTDAILNGKGEPTT